MATIASPGSPTLDAPLRASLDGLRRRIRRYVWVHGLSTVLGCLGVAFWLSLVLDWFFEPSRGLRVLLLLAAVGALAAVAINMVARRLLVRLTDANMAMLLERRFAQLNDTLLTAVSLSTTGNLSEQLVGDDADRKLPTSERERGDRLHGEMLARTAREASRRMGAVRLGDVFSPVPLRRSLSAAVLLLLTIVAFVLLAPNSLGVWARRSLLLSEELWPRQTRLGIEGFDDGVCKVARGADLEIVATADLDMPLVPKTVEVRYRTESGARGRAAMNRQGVAVPGRDRFQQYTYTFEGILSPIDFELAGGDTRLTGLRIEVVESPKIEQLLLRCEYPAYMARSVRVLPVIGPMQIPQGTRLLIAGRANKPLLHVRVDTTMEDLSAKPVLPQPTIDIADRSRFRCALGSLEKDVALFFTLHDTDGIESPQPARVVLAAMADQTPELSVALSGIGTAITPRARLPVVGHVRDDYGIAQVWFEYAADQDKPTREDVAAPEGNLTELPVDNVLEVQDLQLAPGQKFLIGLRASDRYDLDPAPHVGASQRWQLDVVTPEQLRIMLQARELTLRHRFERTVQEVAETGDSLMRMRFGRGRSSTPRASDESGDEPSDAAGAEPEDKSSDSTGREPGDAPEPGPTRSSAESRKRQLAADSLRLERAIQNSRKNGNETLGTAEAFEDIRLQFINNRIDTEELNMRLKSGIADPLRVIAEEMFPELEVRLLALREALDDPQLAPARRDAAKRQLDAILEAMSRVLGRMMEMEDFNEVIKLLQEIIESQENLEKQTRQRHKALLRDVLEDK